MGVSLRKTWKNDLEILVGVENAGKKIMDLRGYELRFIWKTCLRYPFQSFTWNPNDPCFDWKRPCFGGLTFKNRGQLGIAWGFLLIDICSHEPNHFNIKKTVRCTMALGCTGRGGFLCLGRWCSKLPTDWWGGCGTCSFSRYTGVPFSFNRKSPGFLTLHGTENLSYTMVYKWFVMGVEVSCLLVLKLLKEMEMAVSSITRFFTKTSPGKYEIPKHHWTFYEMARRDKVLKLFQAFQMRIIWIYPPPSNTQSAPGLLHSFFTFGNPNRNLHFVTVILGWWEGISKCIIHKSARYGIGCVPRKFNYRPFRRVGNVGCFKVKPEGCFLWCEILGFFP